MDTLTFGLLSEHKELVPVLAEWFKKTWEPYYGKEGPGDATADLMACCNSDKIPLALVAFLHGEPCGTVSLKNESISTHTHLSPWVAALVVEPSFREKGVATLLNREIEVKARELGYQKLYVGADKFSGPLEQNGWIFMEPVSYLVGDGSILFKEL